MPAYSTDCGATAVGFVLPNRCDTRSVRPRGGGDPVLATSTCLAPGPPLARGRTENVAPRVHIYSVVKQPCALRRVNELHSGKKRSAPVLLLGAGIRPTSSFFHLPRNRGGRRADKAQCPDCSGRGVRIAPDDEVHCDAPRASRRANEHLRAYALPTTRTGQDLFVPGRFARAPPVGKVASTSPAGALPLPARKTPHENAPRRWIGIAGA